jgi:hypothetical protein
VRNTLSTEFRLIVPAILAIVVPYGLLLYFLPGQNATYWAWVIPNPRSAMLIGAPYIAATAYYILVLRQNDWSQAQNGMGGLVVFALALLFATMAHWQAFRPYHPTTLAWLILYYAGPLLFPIIYRLQVARSGPAREAAGLVSPAWHTWLVARGCVYFALAIAGFIWAPALGAAWPWPIEPLELRVFMGQVAIVGWHGVVALTSGRDWRRHRLGLVLIGGLGALHLLALLIGSTGYNVAAPLGIWLPAMFAEWLLTPVVMLAIFRKHP